MKCREAEVRGAVKLGDEEGLKGVPEKVGGGRTARVPTSSLDGEPEPTTLIMKRSSPRSAAEALSRASSCSHTSV